MYILKWLLPHAFLIIKFILYLKPNKFIIYYFIANKERLYLIDVGLAVTEIPDNAALGSGAVVTKDIPTGVIAVGNPCKVFRKITEEDTLYWEKQKQEYFASK